MILSFVADRHIRPNLYRELRKLAQANYCEVTVRLILGNMGRCDDPAEGGGVLGWAFHSPTGEGQYPFRSTYQVFVVTDASGTFNTAVREAAWTRMANAGAQLMHWLGVACERHRDWRNDIDGLGHLLSNHIPA
jgi:hypothetical protein